MSKLLSLGVEILVFMDCSTFSRCLKFFVINARKQGGKSNKQASALCPE